MYMLFSLIWLVFGSSLPEPTTDICQYSGCIFILPGCQFSLLWFLYSIFNCIFSWDKQKELHQDESKLLFIFLGILFIFYMCKASDYK